MKLTLFIFSLLFCNSLFSQLDSIVPSKYRWKVGIQSTFGIENRMEDLTTTNSITYSNHKHFFSLGFIKSWNSYKSSRKNGGVEFNYNYYPNTNFKRVDLFIFNRTFLLREKYSSTITVNYTNWPAPQVDNLYRENTRRYFETFFGYGLRLNISKRLYLIQCNALGLTFEGYTNITKYSLHPNYSMTESQKLFDHTVDAGYSIQLGLGFRF